MKNFFITACYETENRYSFDATTTKEDYKQLTMKCIDSFMRNLKNIDEVIILTGKKETYHEMFEDIFWRIHHIYHANRHCNIIWSDSDNLCLKPIDIFNEFDKFSMFWSDPKHQFSFMNQVCLDEVAGLTPWMMANLRYYPAKMNDEVWKQGANLAHYWVKEWAYETIIYNKMFHSQGITDFKKYDISEWNVQCDKQVGAISPEIISEAIIIHCQSTRGSREAIEKMDRAQKFQREG